MKKILTLIALQCITLSIFCQIGEGDYHWMISANVGIEAHDKRLFDFPDKHLFLAPQTEFWGTYHYGIDIRRKILQHKKVSAFLGLGLEYENATFLRPFDHFHFMKDDVLILRNLNRYQKTQIPLPFSTHFKLTHGLMISGEIIPHLLIFRSIDHTENNSDVFPYQEGTFELDAVQLRLGLDYQIGKVLVGVNSRVMNVQKIDDIIFKETVKDPRTQQKWEGYNPLRIDFRIGYVW